MFKMRSELHMARKIWHATMVLIMVAVYHNVSRSMSLTLLSTVALFFVSADLLRLKSKSVNKILIGWFGPLMRKSELHNLAGTTYLLVGAFIVVLLFPAPVVSLALFFLAIADPTASYVGILYGKDKILRDKSLQGSVAAFAVCTIISFVYYYVHELMLDRLVMVSILSGGIGMTAELIPVGRLDDNFTFPIISAFLLWLLFYLFGV